jgi:hypothetical protein
MKDGDKYIYTDPLTKKEYNAVYGCRREVKEVLFDFFEIEGKDLEKVLE